MAKSSPFQESFQTGEVGPKVTGRVGNERYKTAMAKVQNYLPTIQGPLVRRPGFKYSGANIKDPSKPPTFIEFKFSESQNYVLEFGDYYLRFFTQEGQVITSSTHFHVIGNHGAFVSSSVLQTYSSSNFYAVRTHVFPVQAERILEQSPIAASSVLELTTPYSYLAAQQLKVAQKDDVLYITCSSLPEHKLERYGHSLWELKTVNNFDGPYLPLNTYTNLGDSTEINLITHLNAIGADATFSATTGPRRTISGIVGSAGSSGLIRITSNDHFLYDGQKIVVTGVAGTTEANNGTSTIEGMYWRVKYINSNTFDLHDSAYTNSYVGSGYIYPALFEPYRTATEWADVGRSIAIVNNADAGKRFGVITRVHHMYLFDYAIDSQVSAFVSGTGSSANSFWYLGVWNRKHGFPQAVAFHQDRKWVGGCPQFPSELNGSVVGEYENFAASGSSFVSTDASAIQRSLLSSTKNPIVWLKSDANGLLAGASDYEWKITPSNQANALTPTNFNATPTGSFGSHNADAVAAGNTQLYIQKGQRRIRELNYFYQVDTYRSTDLAELSDHLTSPGLKKLSVQKESIAAIWGLRTDGKLVSMTYSRDDVSLKVGWASHILGGRSDSANTPPPIKTMAVIPSSDGTFDNLWVAVQRYINGTTVGTVEFMTDHFDGDDKIEDAFYVDCGGTYDNPVTISSIVNGTTALVTCNTSHLMVNGDDVTIRGVIGLNSSFVDTNNVEYNSNLVNYRYFEVASATATSFYLKDYGGAEVNPTGYSAYYSGGYARKMVTSISGVTWLKNETIAVLADGKIHNSVTVNSAGVLTLEYPAATVQFGYKYNSDGKTLRPDSGSRDGSSIGDKRRPSRAAFMLHNVGEIQVGPSFDKLTPIEEVQKFIADSSPADITPGLFSGMTRDSLESEFNYDGQICFRQSDPLPGMVQTLTVSLESNDV